MSSQVSNSLVLSFLITQQSAHHFPFGKMGTTLSTLIKSEQKDKETTENGKPDWEKEDDEQKEKEEE